MDAAQVTSLPYYCPACQRQVGKMIHDDGIIRLLLENGWLINSGRRCCPQCHQVIYFRASREPWEEVVHRYQKNHQLA